MSLECLNKAFKSEEDRQTAQILATIIRISCAGYSVVFLLGLYNRDWHGMVVTLAGIIMQIVPYRLLAKGFLRTGSILLLLAVLGTLATLATVGQGIRDFAIIAFPITYFLARLSLNRTCFKICVGITLAVVGWLVFGEQYGWFVPKPFGPPYWLDFLIVTVILLVAAGAVDILASNTQKNLQRTKIEIAERERAEEALRESKKRLEDIIFSLSDWVWEIDRHGRYTYSSSRGSDILGRTTDEILGKRPFDFMERDEAKKISAIFSEMMRKKEPIKDLENWNIARNGKEVCLLTNGVPILDREGNLKGYRGVDKDITERKQAEEIRAKMEAQYVHIQKSTSLARMAEAIAHNFNNMLAIIIGNLELAIEKESRDKNTPEYLKEAIAAAKRAADISGQMLIILGQSAGTRGLVDICEICRNHVPVLKAAIPPTVTLEVNLPSTGLPLYADTDQIRQIITNLVCNAWESILDGEGTVYLTVLTASPSEIGGTHRFPVDWQPNGKAYICLEVADTGSGIPAKDIDNIFDPFYTNKFTGRGLGLPVVLGIVRAYDGVVTLISKPGEGSIFRVYLPWYGA